MRIRYNERVVAEAREARADAVELRGDLLAREFDRVRNDRAERRRGPVRPDGVDGVGLDLDQSRADLGAGALEALHAVGRLQGRVVAQLRARLEVGFQPRLGRGIDEVFRLEGGFVHLLAHLHRVAAVDEDGGFVLQRHGHAPGAGEAGEPGEALGAGRHVFVLVLVRARHDEPVEPASRQLGAQLREAGRALRAIGGFLERLEDGRGGGFLG